MATDSATTLGEISPATMATHHAYDAQNRLATANVNGKKSTLSYDAFNRPVMRKIGSDTIYFTFDGGAGSMIMRILSFILACWIAISTSLAEYNPLASPENPEVKTKLIEIEDRDRSRTIPIKIYYTEEALEKPVVLFSHGLGGSREGSPFLGKHWAARGYLAVFMQHPGSDEAVWKDVGMLQRISAMRKAASAKNLFLRIEDVPAVLDQLETWQQAESNPIPVRYDVARAGMSGHSFGAITTQVVSGQAQGGTQPYTDPRIAAAVIMSPSESKREKPEAAFGQVSIPWLLMTGTKDDGKIVGTLPEDRLRVFPYLKPGEKFQLVLYDAEHLAFTESKRKGNRIEHHHPAIMGISTAFWDSYLKNDPAAKGWLEGSGPRTLLVEEDQWDKK